MIVSSRLSFCTVMPVGSTPIMATKANATTAMLRAISIIVKARFARLRFGQSGCIVHVLGTLNPGASGQPIDAKNGIIRGIASRCFNDFGGFQGLFLYRVPRFLRIDQTAFGNRKNEVLHLREFPLIIKSN